jgi:peptide-methionine (S)-S-oxide reductase
MKLLALATLALLMGGCRSAAATTPGADPSTGGSQTMQRQAATATTVGNNPGHAGNGTPLTPAASHRLAAFAAGCFWGVEDAFRHVRGVTATAPGYSGGHTASPTYEEVCTHTTGHAETVLVEYDPSRVAYEQLLRAFWMIHDPTQGDRQGPDIGDSYRSVIFTFDAEQAAAAKASLAAEQKTLDRRITTTIEPMKAFYIAEGYHQQYAEKTGHHACPIRVSLDQL